MSLLDRCLSAISGRCASDPSVAAKLGDSLLELKALCLELIDDVAAHDRRPVDNALREARHSGDVWNMRSALFGSIALSFGEREARVRLARLDARLR